LPTPFAVSLALSFFCRIDFFLGPCAVQVLVFEGVLTSAECGWLVAEAELAATKRGGWLGDRHRGYATTDLRTSHVSEEVALSLAPCICARVPVVACACVLLA